MPAGPLEGCYFTLAALHGTEHEAHARQLVQENGGRLFTETTAQRVAGRGLQATWQQEEALYGGRPGAFCNSQPLAHGCPPCCPSANARLTTHGFHPPADKSKAFALCPHSLVAQKITQLRSSCPDFKLGELSACLACAAQRTRLEPAPCACASQATVWTLLRAALVRVPRCSWCRAPRPALMPQCCTRVPRLNFSLLVPPYPRAASRLRRSG